MGKSITKSRSAKRLRPSNINTAIPVSPSPAPTPLDLPSPSLPAPLSTPTLPVNIAPVQPRPANPALTQKLGQMRLSLAPIFPIHIERGPPHPAFPPTVLHYWLLTEPEMDSFAAYYHQDRPTEYSHKYPAVMNWDPEFLSAERARRSGIGTGIVGRLGSLGGAVAEMVRAVGSPAEEEQSTQKGSASGVPGDVHMPDVERRGLHQSQLSQASIPGASRLEQGDLTTVERVAIKRRMVGKFIGLRGCETPTWETRARLRFLEARIRKEVEEERAREIFRRGRKWA